MCWYALACSAEDDSTNILTCQLCERLAPMCLFLIVQGLLQAGKC